MSYDSKAVLRDIVSRTRENLGLGITKPNLFKYDVTHLINSMLGLLVIPQQLLSKKAKKENFEKIEERLDSGIIEKFKAVSGKYSSDLKLEDICKCLRDSLAHGNFCFFHNHAEIKSLTFTDYNYFGKNGKPLKKPKKTYESKKIDIDVIKQFIDKFSNAILECLESNDLKYDDLKCQPLLT